MQKTAKKTLNKKLKINTIKKITNTKTFFSYLHNKGITPTRAMLGLMASTALYNKKDLQEWATEMNSFRKDSQKKKHQTEKEQQDWNQMFKKQYPRIHINGKTNDDKFTSIIDHPDLKTEIENVREKIRKDSDYRDEENPILFEIAQRLVNIKKKKKQNKKTQYSTHEYIINRFIDMEFESWQFKNEIKKEQKFAFYMFKILHADSKWQNSLNTLLKSDE